MVHRYEAQSYDKACGTADWTSTQDQSCGTDEGQDRSHWPHWPSWHQQDSETATCWKDLQTAEARDQNAKDEAYVEQYYSKQTERRKRYRVNRKEHVWQAEERLAMSFNDFRPAAEIALKTLDTTPTVAATSPQICPEAPIDKSWVTPSETLADNTATDISFYVDAGSAAAKQSSSSLASSFRLVASNLDAGLAKKRKLDDNSVASSSERMMVRLQTLPGPYLNEIEMQPPPDLYPQEFVPKSYPQPRAQTYSRVVPKMDGKYSSAKNTVRPPFGINLIQHYLEWKQNSKR